MAFYLGIDAGGTKTACALSDDEQILVRARGGSIKPLRVTPQEAEVNLAALLESVSRQSGVSLRDLSGTSIGIAGLRFPETRSWLQGLLQSLVGGPIDICGDEEIALDAVFHGGAGVLMIAGTGSNILARSSRGALLTVGGWGPAIGDEGSGYWIGHEGLSASFRTYDRGEPAAMLDRVIQAWSANSLQDVVAIANRQPFPDFSLLAPLVVECADAGDWTCQETLQRAGKWLAEFGTRAYRKLLVAEGSAQPIQGIAYIGSILGKIEAVRDITFAAIRAELPQVRIVTEEADAVLGALWRARHRHISGLQ